MNTAVSKAPKNAAIGIKLKYWGRRVIIPTAAIPAPALTPIILGDAIGFLKIP